MLKIWLSLGSNIGNRKQYLKRAREKIQQHAELSILRSSTLLENSALLYTDQADFINQILECNCNLKPLELLDFLQQIENELGRIRRFSNGPREIDLDILTFGKLNILNDRLEIPHSGLKDRPYLVELFSEFGLDCQKLALSG